MICPNCKKEVPDGTKFCIYCGAAVGDESQVQSTPAGTQPIQQPQPAPQAQYAAQAQPKGQAAPTPQQPSASQGQPASQQQTDNGKRTKKLNTVLIICLVVLLIVVAVVVTVLVMSHSKKEETAAVPASSAVTAQVQESPATAPVKHDSSIVEPSDWITPYEATAMYNARGTESKPRSYVTLRSAPSRDSAEVTKIPNGSAITVRSDAGYDPVHNIHYNYVDYGNYSGWVRTDFIE